MFDEVVVPQPAGHALAATVLHPVGVHRHPLDEALVGQGDHGGVVGNQFLVINITAIVRDFGAAIVAVLVADVFEVFADDAFHHGFVAENDFVTTNQVAELRVLLENLAALERGELPELHPHHGFGLRFGHLVNRGHTEFGLQRREAFVTNRTLQHSGGDFHELQSFLRLGSTRRRAANADHFVER